MAFLFTGKVPDSRNPDCAVATLAASLHAASKSLKNSFFVWLPATCLPQMFSTLYCPVMFEALKERNISRLKTVCRVWGKAKRVYIVLLHCLQMSHST